MIAKVIGTPVLTAAVTSTSTQVLRLTAPMVATLGPKVVGRLL